MEKVGQVLKTTDYSLFKELNGNRSINLYHLKRLKKSMAERFLIVPIIVNKNFEVIDGQHRLQACKELGYPVYFIQNDEYGLREVQVINSNFSTWKADDYISAYASEGNENYVKLREFRDKYGLQPRECIAMLRGAQSDVRYNKMLEMGEFTVDNEAKAHEWGQMILDIRPYYKGYNRRSFVGAMLRVFNHHRYDHQLFLEQLAKMPTALKDCVNQKAYLECIEEIYNYRKVEKNRVRFF